ARDHLRLALILALILALVLDFVARALVIRDARLGLLLHLDLPSAVGCAASATCLLAHPLIRLNQNTVQKTTTAGNSRGSAMVKKIALEEHFLCPGFEDYWKPTVGDVDPAIYTRVVGRLSEFGEQRLAAMDRAGIARAVLAIAGPGVQAERDTGTACRNARAANDFLAREIAK